MTDHSPLWYRMRGLVFGAIFAAGFFVGVPLWKAAGGQHLFSPAMITIAGVLTLICWAVRAWGSAYLHADVVWNPDACTDELIVAGPFRYTRSPLYLGNVVMAAGVGLLATPAGFAIIAGGTLWFALVLARYETQELRLRFGPIVDDYVRDVPALFPRLTPSRVQGTRSVTPSLAQGLRSEIFTGVTAVDFFVLAAFGPRAFPAFSAICAGAWIAQHIAAWNRLPKAMPPEL